LTNVRKTENIEGITLAGTEVLYFQEEDQTVPVALWLDELDRKPRLKCLARLQRLAEMGHELRRPEADYLRDGIYELRASFQGIHYRMLYFFHGRAVVVVSHGLAKEREVPLREIEIAIRRQRRFAEDPKRHTFRPEG
jgi:phage-related protein